MNVAMLLTLPAMTVPEQVAVIDQTGQWTYADLVGQAARIAAQLMSAGVKADDPVAVLSTNRAEYVAAIFGVAAVGACLAPLNIRTTPEAVRDLIEDAGLRFAVVEPRYAPLVADRLPDGHVFDIGRVEASSSDEPVELDVADVDDQTALVLFTSGTTARPKGVRLSHSSLADYVSESRDVAVGDETAVTLLSAPLFHIAGITALLNAIYSGVRVVLLPQFEEHAWVQAVRQHGVTDAFVVPTMLGRILDAAGPGDLDSLRSVTYGAAPMPVPLILRAIDALPNVQFTGSYGQTETCSTVAVLTPEDHRLFDAPPDLRRRRVARLSSIGRPVEDVAARVVDECGADVHSGAAGELLLRTARQMSGYLHGADAPEWLHTRDLARIDDEGYIYLLGRADDVIIRGGENIAPSEVESVLLEHPGVREAAVVGVPDEQWGHAVAAAVVARTGVGLTSDELQQWCRTRLPSFKVPTSIVVIDELPTNAAGKLVRRQLVGLFETDHGSASVGSSHSPKGTT